MLADFYTKPIQCTLFKKFKDAIMGHGPLPTEERVEEGEPTEELTVKHAVGKRTNCKSTYADVVRENMK